MISKREGLSLEDSGSDFKKQTDRQTERLLRVFKFDVQGSFRERLDLTREILDLGDLTE